MPFFPFQGYINLNHSSISLKGYHVPTKGTIQLVRVFMSRNRLISLHFFLFLLRRVFKYYLQLFIILYSQTLFNPNKTVVKMFVVLYDFSDMPPKAQTFLRQRTFSVCKRTCHSGKVCKIT